MLDNKLEEKLKKVFGFLKEHHHFNHSIQRGYVIQTLNAYDAPPQRMLLLLERAVNSQSQPRLEGVMKFWRLLHKNQSAIESYEGFRSFVHHTSHDNLMSALSRQEG